MAPLDFGFDLSRLCTPAPSSLLDPAVGPAAPAAAAAGAAPGGSADTHADASRASSDGERH